MDKIHGEIIDNGHMRWCGSCNQTHAISYICDQYSDELKLQITKSLEDLQDEINDPDWIKGQLEKGIPQTVIRIMQTLIRKSNSGRKVAGMENVDTLLYYKVPEGSWIDVK